MKKNFLNILICIFLLSVSNTKADIFVPFLKSYSKTDYSAANQNWSVKQDSRGFMYFGNHYGLLEFDGRHWELYSLPSASIVRSIYIDKKDRIYVGSFEEFGYFEQDTYGRLRYTSLSSQLSPENLHNQQVWSIVEINGQIFFQTFSGYFVYANGKIEQVKLNKQLLPLNNIDGRIFAYIPKDGLCEFTGKEFRVLAPATAFKSWVRAIIPYEENTYLLATISDGLWLYDGEKIIHWENEAEPFLKKANINRMAISKDSLIIAGTISDGIYAIDKKGKMKWNFNGETGLPTNTVLGIYCDRENNVWLALDQGLAMLRLNSSLQINRALDKTMGFVYDVALSHPYIYFATNQGLFYTSSEKDALSFSEKGKLSRVKGSNDIVQSIFKDKNQIIVSLRNGTFKLQNNLLVNISNNGGGFCFRKQLDKNGEETLLQSTYTSLIVYRKNSKGEWTFSNTLGDLKEPLHSFEIDERGTIWAGHAQKGLFRIQPDKNWMNIETCKIYDRLNSVPLKKTGVFMVGGRLIFTSGSLLYTYDDMNDTIIPYKNLNESVGRFRKAHSIVKIDNLHYWFITDKDAALVNIESHIPKIIDIVNFSEYHLTMLDDFEKIVPVSPEVSLICFENGVAQYSFREKTFSEEFSNTISAYKITVSDGKNKIALLPLFPKKAIKIDYKQNNIDFRVSYPVYGQNSEYLFRYKLEGFDSEWSELKKAARQEYVHLPHGKYHFCAEVVDNRDMAVACFEYPFEILPPFYQTTLAYIMYLILFVLISLLAYSIIRKKMEKAKKLLQEKQNQRIIHLENEKLSDEVKYKSKELAASTMSIIQKNEVLNSIKNELKEQKEKLGDYYPKKHYNKIVKIIDDNLTSERDWEIFHANFDRIHENFFRNLRKKYPNLTAYDLRLCALLRLNLSTKEIAEFMNITVRGVEISRYRLRKKLNIETQEGLNEFMIDFNE
ncbi:MAG: hypothetical protein FWD60_01495 [Candidatus Azobacteroides sp.]|nr:hypothetical protein [Candidatus Azobacteroides sp.]